MMRLRTSWWFSIGWLLAACSVPPGSERAWDGDASAASPGVLAAAEEPAGFAAVGGARPSAGFDADRARLPAGAGDVDVPIQVADRMLVYRGQMRLEVARVEEALATFVAEVKGLGGYLAQQHGAQVVVRVPAAQFEPVFARLRSMGRVLDESREAQDVTEEFIDVGIRLDNARKSRDRLIELLAKADKVEDMLKIEEQLRRLTAEIERLEGRRKLLADQVAMATITAKFEPSAPIAPAGTVARPSQFEWVRQLGAEQLLGGR